MPADDVTTHEGGLNYGEQKDATLSPKDFERRPFLKKKGTT